MWFFNSPEIIFGPGALDYLEEVQGQRAFLVTDANIEALGFVDLVRQRLEKAGLECQVWAEVEPDPALQTVQRGAAAALAFEPDWIIGLGGGSCMDAAKGIWVLYERPDLTPDGINPIERLGLRQKARLIAIPTTSGTGAEATWAIVLTDTAEQRKLGLGSRENLPDMAIVDPLFTANLPPRLTADTGLDALAHAIEGYTNSWANDFCDGPCLKATELVFRCPTRRATRRRGRKCTTLLPSLAWASATPWSPWPTAWATRWAASSTRLTAALWPSSCPIPSSSSPAARP